MVRSACIFTSVARTNRTGTEKGTDMKKSEVRNIAAKLEDISKATDEYQTKIGNLTYSRMRAFTETDAANLATYREEIANLRGIRAGIWTAAELGGFEAKLIEAMIEIDDRKYKIATNA
jgi:hypothetical protein